MGAISAVLPVFRLTPASFDEASSIATVRALLGGPPISTELIAGAVRFRSGTKFVDIGLADSSVWFADEARLWNPDVDSPVTPVGAASAHLDDFNVGLLATEVNQRGPRIHTMQWPEFSTLSATGLGDRRGPTRRLDRTTGLRFGVEVIEPLSGVPTAAPIIGQTARYSVNVMGKDIVGLNAAMWSVGAPIGHYPVVTPADSMTGERDQLPEDGGVGSIVLAFTEFLDANHGWLLVPVWVVHPAAFSDSESSRITPFTVPASSFVGTSPPAMGATVTATASATLAAGIWWTEHSQGSKTAGEVAASIECTLRSHGWNIPFNCGNADARVTHWTTDAANWVETVSLAYFCGHAVPEGWQLRDDHGRVKDVTPPDLEGACDPHNTLYSNLRWIVIDGCGPLHDRDLRNSKGSAIGRWTGAFDGLRVLLGGGTTNLPNKSVGKRFTELAVGTPSGIAAAWFRANQEHRRSTSPTCSPQFFGALAARKAGDVCSSRDIVPSMTGQAALPSAVRAPDEVVALWTPVF